VRSIGGQGKSKKEIGRCFQGKAGKPRVSPKAPSTPIEKEERRITGTGPSLRHPGGRGTRGRGGGQDGCPHHMGLGTRGMKRCGVPHYNSRLKKTGRLPKMAAVEVRARISCLGGGKHLMKETLGFGNGPANKRLRMSLSSLCNNKRLVPMT